MASNPCVPRTSSSTPSRRGAVPTGIDRTASARRRSATARTGPVRSETWRCSSSSSSSSSVRAPCSCAATAGEAAQTARTAAPSSLGTVSTATSAPSDSPTPASSRAGASAGPPSPSAATASASASTPLCCRSAAAGTGVWARVATSRLSIAHPTRAAAPGRDDLYCGDGAARPDTPGCGGGRPSDRPDGRPARLPDGARATPCPGRAAPSPPPRGRPLLRHHRAPARPDGLPEPHRLAADPRSLRALARSRPRPLRRPGSLAAGRIPGGAKRQSTCDNCPRSARPQAAREAQEAAKTALFAAASVRRSRSTGRRARKRQLPRAGVPTFRRRTSGSGEARRRRRSRSRTRRSGEAPPLVRP